MSVTISSTGRTAPTRRSRRGDHTIASLEAFMIGGSPAEVEPEVLVAHGLAGYAVARAKEVGHDLDESVHRARLAAAARHLVARRRLARLVTSWAAGGIEVLIFKGFALAEYDYPESNWRTYSDVDLAIRETKPVRTGGDGREGTRHEPADVTKRAAEIAMAMGFLVEGRPEVGGSFDSLYGASYNGHAVLQVFDPTRSLVIDVHARIVHNSHDESTDTAKSAAITKAVWREARCQDLAGAPVRVPTPVDSAVVGLILSRSWSTDASRLRPRDYLDLVTLSRLGVDRHAIEARAAELGCVATARHFLSRCDPGRGRLDLRPPNVLTRLYYDTLHAPERGHRTLAVRVHEAKHLPKRTMATIAQLGNVWRHTHRWRSGPPPLWPAESLPLGSTALDRETWRLTQFALRRAFQVSGMLRPQRHESLALACLLYALRVRGVPVTRRHHDGVDWLELNGESLKPTVLGFREPPH